MRYLNFILTVIAICLIYQCVRDTAVPARAQAVSGPVLVKVVNSQSETIPIELRRVSSLCPPVPVIVRNR